MIADYVCRMDITASTKKPAGRKTSDTQPFTLSGESTIPVDNLVEELVASLNLLSKEDIKKLIQNVIGSMKSILNEKPEKVLPCK